MKDVIDMDDDLNLIIRFRPFVLANIAIWLVVINVGFIYALAMSFEFTENSLTILGVVIPFIIALAFILVPVSTIITLTTLSIIEWHKKKYIRRNKR